MEQDFCTLPSSERSKSMQDEEITKWVGKPTSHWIGNQWIPTEGSRLYTTDELRHIFSRECVLFVGDSLQRRAADTLHLALTHGLVPQETSHNSTSSVPLHTPNVPNEVFSDYYFNNKEHDRGFKHRFINDPDAAAAALSKDSSSSPAEPQQALGCIATDWRPLLSDIKLFAENYHNETELYGKYTTVVIGSAIWDVVGSSQWRTTATMVRENTREAIQSIANNLPLQSSNVLVVWKSAGWCDNCGWNRDEQQIGRRDNYKVFAANDEARVTIEQINSSNFHYIDWGREVLPRSLGNQRLRSNDNNPYHYGLEPRLQFLQMLAEVLDNSQKAKQQLDQSYTRHQHANSEDSSKNAASSIFETEMNSRVIKMEELTDFVVLLLVVALLLFKKLLLRRR